MITVSVKKLVAAIEEAEAFNLPDMMEGTRYLYDNLYRKLSCGMSVGLSDINFGAFMLDDVDTIRELHSDIFEPNEYRAETIARSLRGLLPTVAVPAFV